MCSANGPSTPGLPASLAMTRRGMLPSSLQRPSAESDRKQSFRSSIPFRAGQLLPRETVTITTVLPTVTQRPSPSDHRVGVYDFVYEATSGFTCVTACSFAVWKLTTPRCRNAAPSCYRGARTTPQAGLEPARLTTVTANGQALEPPPQEKVRPEVLPRVVFLRIARSYRGGNKVCRRFR